MRGDRAAQARLPAGSPRICLSAQGEPFDAGARGRSWRALPGLLLVAGRYEGIDERVVELGIDRELSVGDYVLSGGELPALVVIDALARLLPGALGDERSSVEDSFAQGLLDWPHYTRPEVFEGRQRAGGADVGRSRRRSAAGGCKQSVGRTWLRRPELIGRAPLDAGAQRRCWRNFCTRAARRRGNDRGKRHEQDHPGTRSRAHDAQGAGLQARRHRGGAGQGGRRRPRARAGLRRRRHRAQQPRLQLLLHGAQDLARRGRGAHVPDLQPRISDIAVKRRGSVRRAKLYYLRDLAGKAARIEEKV